MNYILFCFSNRYRTYGAISFFLARQAVDIVNNAMNNE